MSLPKVSGIVEMFDFSSRIKRNEMRFIRKAAEYKINISYDRS